MTRDRRVLPAARSRAAKRAGAVNDPAEAERYSNARTVARRRSGTSPTGFPPCAAAGRRFCSSARGSTTTSRDFANAGASMIMDVTRDTLAAAARGNVSIYGIDPRGLTNLADETIEVGAFPDDTSLGIGTQSIQNELRLSQMQPAGALRGHRRASPSSTRTTSRLLSIASCATTARTTRWRITRRPGKRARSTRSKSAFAVPICASARARVTSRRSRLARQQRSRRPPPRRTRRKI